MGPGDKDDQSTMRWQIYICEKGQFIFNALASASASAAATTTTVTGPFSTFPVDSKVEKTEEYNWKENAPATTMWHYINGIAFVTRELYMSIGSKWFSNQPYYTYSSLSESRRAESGRMQTSWTTSEH